MHGISDAEIRSIMRARADRAFRDVGDFMRRTTVSRPVTEALAHAGAFDALEPARRRHLYVAMTAEAEREGDQLTLTMGADPAEGTASRTTPTPRWCGPSSRCWASTPPGTS